MDHSQGSLDRILRSGEYLCRPRRQIFVEHVFFNRSGQKTREVTKADLDAIAETGNRLARETGDLTPIGVGHTSEDQFDDKGMLVRKFAESEQPKPIGYLHNYVVAQRQDGKWALYVDEWIKRTIQDERGAAVDGLQYAASFPRRSAEYYPSKKWIDWLALLRRAPALNLGMDVYSLQRTNPDKVCYSLPSYQIAAVETSQGKWRYEDQMDDTMPASGSAPAAPAAAPPPNSPAAAADVRPPVPSADQGLQPEHAEAADKYALHATGIHPTRLKPLMHFLHNMHGGACGMNGDPSTPHVPAPAVSAAAPAATPAASTPPPPHQQSSAGPGTPSAGNTFIPGSEEKRMHQVQDDIAKHRNRTETEKLRFELDELKQQIAVTRTGERKANYERDLTALLGMGYELTLSEEVQRAEKWAYAEDRCAEQLACIKKNYQHAPIGSGFVPTGPGAAPNLPSRDRKEMTGGVTYEERQKAQRYALENGCKFDEALEKIRG